MSAARPYVITVRERRYRFATLQEAKDAAERYMQRTGFIVGITLEG